jgi:hypothetical protein
MSLARLEPVLFAPQPSSAPNLPREQSGLPFLLCTPDWYHALFALFPFSMQAGRLKLSGDLETHSVCHT